MRTRVGGAPRGSKYPKILRMSLMEAPLQYDYKIEFGPRRLDPEPHGIQLARGPAAVAVTRASADRAATWQVSHDLLNWLQVRKLH